MDTNMQNLSVMNDSVTQRNAAAIAKTYRQHLKERADKTDEALARAYEQIARGQRVIDIEQSFRNAGCDERGRPKLAIVRADAPLCYYFRHTSAWGSRDRAGHIFGSERIYNANHTRTYTRLPLDTLTTDSTSTLKAITPSIPPQYRPAAADLWKYHIIWEAEWHGVPIDPILVKRIGGYLFTVLAEWDLTALERAMLKDLM
jgi:hypothetical protein